jgi:uncharacterized protein YciI
VREENQTMGLFVVTREAGSGWRDGVGAFEQPGAHEHGAFMNGLHEEGLVLFAGPLAGSEADRIRVLLIANAEDQDEIERRLSEDPWAIAQRLVTTAIEPWLLVVGSGQL